MGAVQGAKDEYAPRWASITVDTERLWVSEGFTVSPLTVALLNRVLCRDVLLSSPLASNTSSPCIQKPVIAVMLSLIPADIELSGHHDIRLNPVFAQPRPTLAGWKRICIQIPLQATPTRTALSICQVPPNVDAGLHRFGPT